MEIKTVLYLLRDKLENLPPSMSQITTLCELGCQVKVVTMHTSDYIHSFYAGQNVEFITLKKRKPCKIGAVNKVQNLLAYRRLVREVIKNHPHDLLWVGSGDTARYCRDIVAEEKPLVLNIYELYDKAPQVLKAIKPIAQNAQSVVVPEYNRAHILKVWLGLRRTPVIIPNKPRFPEVKILPETQAVVDKLKAMDKKIVLYQGWIGKGRDVTRVAAALNTLPNKDDFALVLMGSATASDSISSIQEIFTNTIHIPFLQPPQHLFVTEVAQMGIATYDDSSLNNIFCAPNKIYEYAEKNVPILARNIPGLSSTVGAFKAGVCADMDDIQSIADAIREISDNHTQYVNSLKDFLNEYSIEDSIRKIIRSCEESMNHESKQDK